MNDLEKAERQYMHEIQTMPDDERIALKEEKISKAGQRSPATIEFLRAFAGNEQPISTRRQVIL